MSYILALDQGTTSSRSIVFDRKGKIVSASQKEHSQIFPHTGWIEHDPNEIWRSQTETAVDALSKAGLTAHDIDGVGIANQRETTVIWNRQTGLPIYNAIVWQDRRTASICDEIRSQHRETIRQKTGLEVDAYFSASKIKWLLDNCPGARSQAENGDLAFGTFDTWLIWNLSAGKLHITDPSNACRTMLFNINTCLWDDQLLSIFEIPRQILPDVRPSSEIAGEVESPRDLKGIKIAGLVGDQQSALFGQACFESGSAKNTYGTGCFMLQNTGDQPIWSTNRLLTTISWQIDGQIEYALEGSVFNGGAVVQWLRDSMGLIARSDDVEALAESVQDNGGVFFVPAFAGLGAPYWDQDARGLIIGLTRGTGAAHIARAAIESIAFQTADLITAMNADSGSMLSELRVDGGASCNDPLLQFQADILQTPVVRSQIAETTALGAAYLAGLAVGYWNDKTEIARHWTADRRFEPTMPLAAAQRLIDSWHDAVHRSRNWTKNEEA